MPTAHLRQHDPWSVIVIILTLSFFLLAMVLHGFTHDLLLEIGVLLVSVKLILLGHKSITSARMVDERLQQIQNTLLEIQQNTH
jgi:hypothetical protein